MATFREFAAVNPYNLARAGPGFAGAKPCKNGTMVNWSLNPILGFSGLRLAALLAASALLCFSGSALASAEKAAVFYEDALKRFERDDVEGAIVQLKNSLRQNNKLLAAHMLLGKSLVRSGDFKGAEAAFEEALKQGVSRAEVAMPLGRIYIALGKPALAVERFSPVGMLASQQVAVLAMRGTAHFEMGNPREAARSFEEARKIDPKSALPLIEEIPTLLLTGQKDRARALAVSAIALDPKNASAWNMQASVLHDALDMNGALAAYNQALALEPRHVDARVARAAVLLDLGREADAAKDLEFLVDNAPEEPRAAYLRAMLSSKKRDEVSAKKHLGEAASVIDALPKTWLVNREQLMMLAALSHHGLGNLQKSREYLDIILARNPKNDSARKLLASIFVQTRDYARAMPLLESLRKSYGDDPQLLYQLGSAYLGQRRYLLAVELLERSVARTGAAEASRALAFSQVGLGRDDIGQAILEKVFAANAGDAEAGMALATLYRRRGDAQKALKTAEAMVKRAPTSLALLNFLGSVKAANGDKAGARAAYEQVLTRAPRFRPAILNLVKLDAAEGKFDQGRKRVGDILAKDNADIDTLYELGMLEQRAARPAEAERHLRKASEAQRRDTRPGLALVDLLISRKQADQAVTAAKELASKFPDDLGIQLALARSHTAVGDRGNARSVLQGATRIAEFDTDLQVAIGRMQLQAANPDGAAYNVQKALQGRPDDLEALVLAVDAEMQRKDAAKADAALKTLSAKHPNRIETVLATAEVALARGQHQLAITGYRAALARQESTAVALRLVQAHFEAGEAAKAAAFLETWVAKRPSDIIALKALAEAQHRAGQLPAARLNYTKALATDGDDAPMLNNFANLLHKLGDAGAQAAAEKAVKLAPENPAFADTLGWILVQKGQVEAGVRYLREARLRSPENAEIRFHLAFALAKMGRKSEARDELAAALKGKDTVLASEEVAKLSRELGM